jgi:hypothetical protein
MLLQARLPGQFSSPHQLDRDSRAEQPVKLLEKEQFSQALTSSFNLTAKYHGQSIVANHFVNICP